MSTALTRSRPVRLQLDELLTLLWSKEFLVSRDTDQLVTFHCAEVVNLIQLTQLHGGPEIGRNFVMIARNFRRSHASDLYDF